MTFASPDTAQKKPGKGLRHSRLFHGRDPGPLLGPWLACSMVAIATYIFERKMPAFHDVVGPFYWLLIIIIAVATWRWARGRARARGDDRRHMDRRKGDRSKARQPRPS